MIEYEKRYISELCLEYSFGDTIDEKINKRVLKLYRYIKESSLIDELKILDLIPTYNNLAIHFNIESQLFYKNTALENIIQNIDKIDSSLKSTLHYINVDYSGVDTQYVCQRLAISKKELISLHANKEYTIAMIGFRPYFPYLLGLDEKLKLPRRDNPRTIVKKGSVAIAAGQTGIYSEDSPGGWHIIGYTSFDKYHTLKAGDKIIFKEVFDAN